MTTRRRANGEGGVRQRPDGRWEASIDLGDQDGRRRRKFYYGTTQAEAVAKLRAAHARQDARLPLANERKRTGQFLEHWYSAVLPATVKPATVSNYRTLLRTHVVPELGNIPLAKLSPEGVERLLARKRDAGLSPNTVRLIRSVLRRALRDAERRGDVSHNVAAIVDGPRIPRSDRRSMAESEARRLLAASTADRLGALVALLLETGLRKGEALGLRWQDVDLDGRSLRVARTLSRVDGQLVSDEPKTERSQRTVPISEQLASRLRSHRRRQLEERLTAGAAWEDFDQVFATTLGHPLDPSNVRRAIARLCAAAGVGAWRIHELRHTAASLMLANGAPLYVVSEVLGHSGIAITKDVYGHLVADERERAIAAVSAALYRTASSDA
jgi:integrase